MVIFKSYSNAGKDYRFNIFIIEEDGILYPVEIKRSGNLKANMGATNQVLDNIPIEKGMLLEKMAQSQHKDEIFEKK